jgi:hypothetical protein
VHARAARRSSNSAVAAAWRGGDIAAFVRTPLAWASWTRGAGGGQGGHAVHIGFPVYAA